MEKIVLFWMSAEQNKMGEVTTRFFTALFCVVYTLLLNWHSIYTTSLYYLTLTLICLSEYHYQIDSTRKKITIVLSSVVYTLSLLYLLDHIDIKILTMVLPIIMSLFSIELFSSKPVNPMLSLGTDLIGLVWICGPLFLTVVLSYPTINHVRTHNPTIVYGVMFFVFFGDAGAYFCGRLFGTHKLYPSVSPKKTWEGSIGGAIVSLGFWYPISSMFTILNSRVWLIVYLISITGGIIGDLIESMFKRDLKIKDTGTILPGHGGALDRVDGILYSIPFVYSYLVVSGNFV